VLVERQVPTASHEGPQVEVGQIAALVCGLAGQAGQRVAIGMRLPGVVDLRSADAVARCGGSGSAAGPDAMPDVRPQLCAHGRGCGRSKSVWRVYFNIENIFSGACLAQRRLDPWLGDMRALHERIAFRYAGRSARAALTGPLTVRCVRLEVRLKSP
jgi:hypothetical protein